VKWANDLGHVIRRIARMLNMPPVEVEKKILARFVFERDGIIEMERGHDGAYQMIEHIDLRDFV
jgi:hypothetical protein